jgi:hypothetical protein
MRRYLFLALLITTFSANALQSLRVGSQVLVVGDSVTRLQELMGKPVVRVQGSGPGKSRARSKNSKARAKEKGEQWQYLRDGHTTTFFIVGGRIALIEDVAN